MSVNAGKFNRCYIDQKKCDCNGTCTRDNVMYGADIFDDQREQEDLVLQELVHVMDDPRAES